MGSETQSDGTIGSSPMTEVRTFDKQSDNDHNCTNGNNSRHDNDVVDCLASDQLRLVTLKELNCKPNTLSDQDVMRLADLFVSNHGLLQLRSLRLSKNALSAQSAPAVARIVNCTPTLEQLDLSDNDIRTDGLASLVEDALALDSCPLTTLNLCGNKLGCKHAASILLRANRSIHTLLLGHNRLGAKGIKEVASVLHQSAVLHLDLTQNQLDDRAAGLLSKALDPRTSPDCKLQSLNLNNNKIRYKGAYHLADAFVKGNNTTLRSLNLSDNFIEAEGAEAFGVVLRFSHTLQELNLSRNKVGDDGIILIAQGLRENKDSGLKRLDLSWNGIKDQGAGLLADMLKDNSVLTYLNLRSNFICDEGIQKLAQALPSVISLEELDIVGNQMKDPSALIDALCHHETKLLNISYEQNQLSPEAEVRLNAAFHFRKNKQGWLGRLLRDIRSTRRMKRISCNMLGKTHGDEEIIAIVRVAAKHKPHITSALFEGPLVTYRGVTILARELLVPNLAKLGSLTIRQAPVRDKGAAALAQALVSNHTLRCLSLSDCQITEDGARMLSNALRRNSTLKRLNLESNRIGDAGFQALCKVIFDPSPHEPSNLISLNVAYNKITDRGLSGLPPIVGEFDELHLEGNDLTDFGALDLAKAIYDNTSLRWLNVRQTQISKKGITTLSMYMHCSLALDHDGR